MSKIRLVFLAAAAVLSQLPAYAQGTTGGSGTATTQITITGEAKEVCKLVPAPSASGVNASYSNNTLTLTDLLDPQTAFVKSSTIRIQFSDAMCNYAADLSLMSKNGGLTSLNAVRQASGAGTFIETVPYTAVANWGAIAVTLDTNVVRGGTPISAPAGGANNAELSVTIATQTSALPVPQGNYSDTLTIQIGPKL